MAVVAGAIKKVFLGAVGAQPSGLTVAAVADERHKRGDSRTGDSCSERNKENFFHSSLSIASNGTTTERNRDNKRHVMVMSATRKKNGDAIFWGVVGIGVS